MKACGLFVRSAPSRFQRTFRCLRSILRFLGVIDCNPQGEGKGDRELWTAKEYADFELWVDWRIKESPYVNKKARIILPDGSYQKDDSGNVMTVAAPNTDSGGTCWRSARAGRKRHDGSSTQH